MVHQALKRLSQSKAERQLKRKARTQHPEQVTKLVINTSKIIGRVCRAIGLISHSYYLHICNSVLLHLCGHHDIKFAKRMLPCFYTILHHMTSLHEIKLLYCIHVHVYVQCTNSYPVTARKLPIDFCRKFNSTRPINNRMNLKMA